jgi:hypothetical protein
MILTTTHHTHTHTHTHNRRPGRPPTHTRAAPLKGRPPRTTPRAHNAVANNEEGAYVSFFWGHFLPTRKAPPLPTFTPTFTYSHTFDFLQALLLGFVRRVMATRLWRKWGKREYKNQTLVGTHVHAQTHTCCAVQRCSLKPSIHDRFRVGLRNPFSTRTLWPTTGPSCSARRA